MAELASADNDRRRVVVLPVTCCRDDREHLVAEDAIVPMNAGRYTAICGHRVLAAVLACPPGPPCRHCLAVRSTDKLREQRNLQRQRRGVCTRLTSQLNLGRPIWRELLEGAWIMGRRHPPRDGKGNH